MTDVRFPTALQLMLNLAFAHAEGVAQLSSAQLAGALGTNPSLVRKLLKSPRQSRACPFEPWPRRRHPPWPTGGSDDPAGHLQRRAWREEPVDAATVHQCIVSSNVERYFVDLAAKADDAVLRMLEHSTLAESLSELRS